MKEEFEEESKEMLKQQMECCEFSFKMKQNISNKKIREIENSFDIFHEGKYW